MGSLHKWSLVAVAAWLLVVGCATDGPWTAARDTSYRDDIQKQVRAKLTEQTEDQPGADRWSAFAEDEYQIDDVEVDPKRVELEKNAHEAARTLVEGGPLILADCLAYSLEFNDRVQAARAVIRSVGGTRLIAKSRFLPRLVYDLTASVSQNVNDNFAHGAALGVTAIEFGKDNPVDVALRDVERRALFQYERVIAGILAEVRLRFFTILLKQDQLDVRRELRKAFVGRYDRMVKLEDERRVLRLDVLTAKLNILNEESRINALTKEIQREKMDLSHVLGFPVRMTGFDLAGAVEAFKLPIEDAVDLATRRSTRIAQARAVVFERDRVLRQIVWEYFPNVRMQAGISGSTGAAGVDMRSDNDVYSVNPFAERNVDSWTTDAFARDPSWLASDPSGWRWGVDVQWPVASGMERTGRFQRAKSLLEEARHLMNNTVSLTELETAKAYETVLEEAREADILEETVRVSWERLGLQEKRKEEGEIGDDELETFRERFFGDQDAYFEQQIRLIRAQERLRLEMRYFEPIQPEGEWPLSSTE